MSNGDSVLPGRDRAETYTDPPALYLKDDENADRVLAPGEVFSGRVVSIRRARGQFFGDRMTEVPVVTAVELDPETGEELESWNLWLFHQVPQEQFRQQAPQVGDLFHLKRLENGTSEAYGEYVRTALVLPEGEASEFAWGESERVPGAPEVDPETGEIMEPGHAG